MLESMSFGSGELKKIGNLGFDLHVKWTNEKVISLENKASQF